MSSLSISNGIHFDFHLVTAVDSRPNTDGYGDEDTNYILANKPDDAYEFMATYNYFNALEIGKILSGAIVDKAEALSLKEKVENNKNLEQAQCLRFHAEFYPVVLSNVELESLKFHLAIDLTNEFPHYGSDVRFAFKDIYPKVTGPVIPKEETIDGAQSSYQRQTYYALTAEMWEKLHAARETISARDFGREIYNAYEKDNFDEMARDFAENALTNPIEDANVMVFGRLYAPDLTVTPKEKIVDAPAVKAQFITQLQGNQDKRGSTRLQNISTRYLLDLLTPPAPSA